MRIGSLFSGYGGLDMAVESVFPGATPAWFCEWDEAPSQILAHHWPDVPNHRDVTQVDWTQVEPVDILTGGYPCQPFSASGLRKGTDDERHLWPYVREAIRHLRPRFVVLENVAGHRSLGFDRVLGDMAEDGMHVWWTSVRASDIGAPHHRDRVFILAVSADAGGEELSRRAGLCADESEGVRRARLSDRHNHSVEWGKYGPAVRRGGISGAHTTESRPEEVLRDMRRGVLPETVQWPTRGQNPIPREEDVRAIMREQQEVRPSGFSPVASSSVDPEGSVRELRIEDWLAHSPQGQGPGEQLAGESSSSMRELSPETPLEGGSGVPSVHNQDVDWGPYAPAIRRWERVLGRPAPAPTELNTKGKPRLNAAFAEYMMGLPAGWVTGPVEVDDADQCSFFPAPPRPLHRADQLKAIGNGVCPQQAAAALEQLLALEAVAT